MGRGEPGREMHSFERFWITAALLAACSGPPVTGPSTSALPAHAPAPIVEPHTDVVSYDVDLRLEADGSVVGDVTITVEPTLALDLVLDRVDVRSIEDAETGSPILRDGGRLRVAVGAPPLVRIRIRYRARPDRGLRVVDGITYTSFHTSDWLPVHFAPSDRATLRLVLSVPEEVEVAATGHLAAAGTGGGITSHVFELEDAHPAYLFGFVAGPLDETVQDLDGVEHRVLSTGLEEADVAPLVDRARAAIAFFAEVAGQPYPGESFTQVWLPGDVAQELAGMAFMRVSEARAMLADPDEDWLLVHEIAHQWWGNAVTCESWGDFWLNEGFATFMVAAFKERRVGRAAYDREVELARARLARMRSDGRDRALVLGAGVSAEDAGGPLVYSKGLLFLHALRTELGEDTFWRGVRRYTGAHWRGSATTEDLRRAFEAEADRDLREIFATWGALPAGE